MRHCIRERIAEIHEQQQHAGEPPLTAVLVDAVRLTLAETPRFPLETQEYLESIGLRPRPGLVRRAIQYLFWGGELLVDHDGRYQLAAPAREPAIRRRAIS